MDMGVKETHLPWPDQVARIDAELDHDLRQTPMFNTGMEARCLAQLIRLLRAGMQIKPTET